MDAMEIYESINSDSTDEEKLEACKAILEADGNRAMAIYLAKSDGWWKDEVAEPCQAILEAPGNRAWAIYLTKSDGWWKDEVAEPCQAIMEDPGDRAMAIKCAKRDGWWRDPNKDCVDGLSNDLSKITPYNCNQILIVNIPSSLRKIFLNDDGIIICKVIHFSIENRKITLQLKEVYDSELSEYTLNLNTSIVLLPDNTEFLEINDIRICDSNIKYLRGITENKFAFVA